MASLDSVPIGIVVPAYNEALRMAPTLDSAQRVLQREYGSEYELIVADDGSTDATTAIAEDFGATVLSLPHRGKGAAVKAGMLHSTAQHRAFMDSDGSFETEDVLRLIDRVQDEADVAIMVRSEGLDAFRNSQHTSGMRAVGSRMLAAACERIAPTGVSDTQCGAKAFKGNVAESLFGVSQIDGYAADREVLFLANALGFRVVEQAGTITPKDGSKVRPVRDGIRLVRDAASIRRLHGK